MRIPRTASPDATERRRVGVVADLALAEHRHRDDLMTRIAQAFLEVQCRVAPAMIRTDSEFHRAAPPFSAERIASKRFSINSRSRFAVAS